jgi:hypothetical protein
LGPAEVPDSFVDVVYGYEFGRNASHCGRMLRNNELTMYAVRFRFRSSL